MSSRCQDAFLLHSPSTATVQFAVLKARRRADELPSASSLGAPRSGEHLDCCQLYRRQQPKITCSRAGDSVGRSNHVAFVARRY
jgi:hypothetical protein